MFLDIQHLAHSYIPTSQKFPIDVSVKKGETLGIIGCNGSGKTSLLKLILNTLKPQTGRVFLKTKPAFLSTFHPFKENLTVKQQIPLFLENAASFPWQHWWKKKIQDLSAGQKRLIALWVLFQQQQQLYIVDEPFSFLDDNARAQVIKWMNIKTTSNASIIFTNQTIEHLKDLGSLKILEI